MGDKEAEEEAKGEGFNGGREGRIVGGIGEHGADEEDGDGMGDVKGEGS